MSETRAINLVGGRAIHVLRRLLCAGAIFAAANLLSACGNKIVQNFRITVEDSQGKFLGSGVWSWSENISQTIGDPSGSFDGEAFPIQHPTLGKMYVTKGGNSGRGGGPDGPTILAAYQAIGSIPEVRHRYPSSNTMGDEGAAHISRMNTRVELPRANTPQVVRFNDDRDPFSAQLVMTYSRTRRPIESDLRFFVQPTKDPVTTGILRHLPWLPKHPDWLLGELRSIDHLADRRSEEITGYSFLLRRDYEAFVAAQKSKKP